MIQGHPRSSRFAVAWVVLGSYTLETALSCGEGEWVDSSGACSQCALDCPVGTFREGCAGTEEGQCVPCTNTIPEFSKYVAGGGLLNGCPFACDVGHYLTGEADNVMNPLTCKECNVDCPLGKYLKGCSGASAGSCVDCSPPVEGAVYTGNGGLSDDCSVECNSGYYSDMALTTCFKCNQTCEEGSFRSQCMGTSPGFCAPCTNGPEGVVYTDYGDKHGHCPYCELDTYAVGEIGNRKCIPCSPTCPIGQFRDKCGGVTVGSCIPCTNGPPHSHYTSNGKLRNECDFGCDTEDPDVNNKDFFELESVCVACESDCPVGLYRLGCEGKEAGKCEPCSVKPPHSHFIGDGGLRDVCPWACDATFSLTHIPGKADTCGKCPEDCAAGFYRANCGLANPGSCVPCTNGPPHSYYTGTGGLTNTCAWECSDTYHEHGGHPELPHKPGVVCDKCGERCPVGQYRTGCHLDEAGTCTDCAVPNPLSIFIGDGDLTDACPWICKDDSYTTDGKCEPCPTDCETGYYRDGCEDVRSPHPKPIVNGITNLGGNASVGSCVTCTNKPPFSYYTGSGGLRNECGWSCSEGTHQGENECLPCNASCGVGYYRVGCSLLNAGTCVECTTAPVLSHYTTDGGLEDACLWQCRANWPVQGPCLISFIVNRVFAILLVICCLGCGTTAVKRLKTQRGSAGADETASKLAMLSRIEEADYRSLPRQDYGHPALHIPGSVSYQPVQMQQQPEEEPTRGRSVIGVFGRVKSPPRGTASSSSTATAANVGVAPDSEVEAMKKLPWAKPQRDLRDDGLGTK